jgi:hypothetical protein
MLYLPSQKSPFTVTYFYIFLKPAQNTHRRRPKNAIQFGGRYVLIAVLNVHKSSSLDAVYRKVRWREVR